jgi:3',5'-cyclic AMP phosphodiesterase CpdA
MEFWMVRLCHLSDIHVTTQPLGWRFEDWCNKRLAAWFNLRVLGRGFRFRDADTVLQTLMDELHDHPPDRLIFSGDATALGFESEIVHAAVSLGLTKSTTLPGLAVPGNHDYCTIPAEHSGHFEKHFAPWQQGERVDGALYPFAQKVGHVWLIAVNTATGNRRPWDASGAVEPTQLQRLATLLHRLEGGPRILVTHYPVCKANGAIERASHGLRDLEEVVRTAANGGISLWLHGHRHHAYHLAKPPQAPFPVICAGSTTQNGLWSFGDYLIEDNHLAAIRRAYDPAARAFREVEAFELLLRG